MNRSRLSEYIETNRRFWDEAVAIHAASSFYDVDSFKAGKSTLLPVERDEMGDVTGKTLLHLQCHFGLDTLSWAREGALVTGVDFAPEAIRTAQGLAEELGISAQFVESNIFGLPEVLEGKFDLVFASYGVLNWLPDLREWAAIVANYVKPGGTFYIVDFHPLYNTFWDSPASDQVAIRHGYFGTSDPPPTEESGTYADGAASLTNQRTFEFDHPLGEVVTSLIDAALRIEFLHEFPFTAFQALPDLQKERDGYFHLPAESPKIPLIFSLRATKP